MSSHPKTMHGIWRILPSQAISEICAQSGMDFQILDCEHGGYDYESLLADIIACERHRCAAWVRVSGSDKVEVQRCLDLGAGGLVFPQLTTCEDFSRAADWMDYAPAGTRGFNPFVRAGGYGLPDTGSDSRARPWFIPIVETLEATEQIDTILQLERIDLIYVGGYDLSAQLGHPGRMDAPDLLQLFDHIMDSCLRAGKPVGMMSLSDQEGRRLMDHKVQALVHGVESHRIKQAITNMLSPLTEVHPTPASAQAKEKEL